MQHQSLRRVCEVGALVGLLLSCSSSGTEQDPGGQGGGGGFGGTGGYKWDSSAGYSGSGSTAGTGGTKHKDLDASWDGQWPTTCGDSGVDPGPHPGGSPDCPDDLNIEGCPCPTVGKTAACWPGERKNRNRGICHDGKTTCEKATELTALWGPCIGALLPDPGVTTGVAACSCFTSGIWHIENLVPCFSGDPYGSLGAASTLPNGECDGQTKPPQLPSKPWSKNTLKIDCAGKFQLCYELKAGSISAPSESDCSLAKICIDADYNTPGVEQPLPELPAWTTIDSACAQKFANEEGYGEMSVVGMSVECDPVPQRAFHRVAYCPLLCKQNPTDPKCKNCGNGQSGQF